MASPSFPTLLSLLLLLVISLGLSQSHGGEMASTATMHDRVQPVMLERFHQWMTAYSRSYTTANEKQRRFEIYRRNIEFIEATNRKLGRNHLGETSFTDLTTEGFAARYTDVLNQPLLCEEPDEEEDDHIMPVITSHAGDVSGGNARVTEIPEAVNWTEMGAVTDVKDQGTCGTFHY